MRQIRFRDLGLIDYATAWELQTLLFTETIDRKIANRSLPAKELLPSEDHPFNSCNNKATTENTTATIQEQLAISDESIFNLDTKWRTEEGKEIELKELKGKVLVVVMIYTSCKAACPRLVADMKAISEQIPGENKKEIQYVLVSIDPDTDTPKK